MIVYEATLCTFREQYFIIRNIKTLLPCVVSGGDPDIVLTSHAGRSAIVLCLVFWSTVCCSSYRHLTHEDLDCKSRGYKPYIVEGK